MPAVFNAECRDDELQGIALIFAQFMERSCMVLIIFLLKTGPLHVNNLECEGLKSLLLSDFCARPSTATV